MDFLITFLEKLLEAWKLSPLFASDTLDRWSRAGMVIPSLPIDLLRRSLVLHIDFLNFDFEWH